MAEQRKVEPVPQFTPGAWFLEDDDVRAGLEAEQLICSPLGNTPEQAAANGHLIAAAPDGFSAADNSVARLETLLAYTTTLTSDDQLVVHECIDELRGFLAKARGEQC